MASGYVAKSKLTRAKSQGQSKRKTGNGLRNNYYNQADNFSRQESTVEQEKS